MKLTRSAYLRLNGVNAKDHAVFRELTRVKQYFEKIKDTEDGGRKRQSRLDPSSAKRFIKHALVCNSTPNSCSLCLISPFQAGNETAGFGQPGLQQRERAKNSQELIQNSRKRKASDTTMNEAPKSINLDHTQPEGQHPKGSEATLSSHAHSGAAGIVKDHEGSQSKPKKRQKAKKTKQHQDV